MGLPLVFSSNSGKVKNRERLYKMLYYYIKAGVVNIVQASEVIFPLFGIKRRGEWLEDLKGKIPDSEFYFLYNSMESGKLEEGLRNLYQHVERIGKTKKNFILSIFFPLLELVVSVGIFIFIVVYVVPRFSQLVEAFGVELPPISKIVFSLGKFLWDYLPILIVLCAGATWYFSRNWERIINLIPFLRKISVLYEKVLLFDTLGFAYSSGYNLHQAFSNVQLKLLDISKAKEEVLNGTPFYVALSPILYPHEVAMLQAAEETGSLDDVLPWLAEMSRDELFARMKKLSDGVVPLITVILGVMVFFVLLAIYLPLMGIAARI
ncbi:MAG: type II secretion system F family protein [Candidatus Aminicenantes bacterium]|nr:type II secretion system F family protein [Candidatus Aminicenantes bacterium]